MTTDKASRSVVVLTCEYPPFPGGIASYSGQVAAALRDIGYAPIVVAPNYPDLPKPTVPEPGVFRLFSHHKITPRAALATFRLLATQPSDAIILAADIRTVLLAASFSILTGRPFRAMVHGSEASKFAGRSFGGAIVRRAYHRAEVILANSLATLNIFTQSFGVPSVARVTYLGIDAKWFGEPSEGTFDNPALSALPIDTRLFVSVGRIEDRKGQLAAVRALAEVKKTTGLPIAYVAVGRTEQSDYAQKVVATAASLELPLIMAGHLGDGDIKLLYRRSIAHLLLAQPHPTKIEGFGLVLLEAGAQHCPSVTTRVGGIPEVVGADCDLLLEPDDDNGIVRALIFLATDEAKRQKEAQRAFDRTSLFSWRRCTELSFPELASSD
ncbi:glycosyltransferase family 4 protein [Sphingomonas sp. BIUV-7]|uniref:Glycosyltransferase family 4 protein n=1 Tax=Sphingomonas natans TaxID=3063330 RepID=A0ABT8YCK9_9SPHN|nr:glycosyltransferase family 4 protein [Sphingomonas sp. BIUV-7]MDO6416065.1 glycosyltransferase family 4 protein [Sphingomonas sp. BIUV-7]